MAEVINPVAEELEALFEMTIASQQTVRGVTAFEMGGTPILEQMDRYERERRAAQLVIARLTGEA